MFNNIKNKLKLIEWHVAYRQLPEGSILEDCKTPFIEIENNNTLCSVMDPFVFEYMGETYIFAEVYHKINGRGEIGYSKWTGNGFSTWKTIIKENYHLSYPFIFNNDKGIFIVPESYQAKNVHYYQAIEFPDKWERKENLINNIIYVDTTLIETTSDRFAFTYDVSSKKHKLLLYKIIKNKFSEEKKCICDDNSIARPGGRFFLKSGQLIRVSQDCSISYGRSLVFSKVSQDFWTNYKEEIICRWGIEELKKCSGMNRLGIHTYNATQKFEVIDTIRSRYSIMYIIFKINQKIKKLIHNILNRD